MTSLIGKILIAMPAMPDPRFAHSVVLICAHSDAGAMGIITNKLLPDLRLSTLLDHLSIAQPAQHKGLGDDVPDCAVQFGGPVETNHGFVVHSPDFFGVEGSIRITDDIVLSTSVQVLTEIARGQGPTRSLTALGYSGWEAQQLEDEIRAGGWLLADADAALLFDTPATEQWAKALDQMGIDPRLLSTTTGHA